MTKREEIVEILAELKSEDISKERKQQLKLRLKKFQLEAMVANN